MDTEQTLLEVIHADPTDDIARLALADALEEDGRIEQAELLRLHLQLRVSSLIEPPGEAFQRLVALLDTGVKPVVPTRTNSLGMLLVLIPPGRFWMGSSPEELDRFDDEGPEHLVEITRPFYLGAFQVTQGEYAALTGERPSYFSPGSDRARDLTPIAAARHPVENLSWDDAQRFVAMLAEFEKLPYRLPTEAEWEYACRACISRVGPFHVGGSLSSLQTNFDGRYPYGGAPTGPNLERTTSVDAYPPNALGIYDMHGNVSEWCLDAYQHDFYRQHAAGRDPRCTSESAYRVLRGGSWSDRGEHCRAAFRYDRPPDEGRADFGVRVLLEHHRT